MGGCGVGGVGGESLQLRVGVGACVFCSRNKCLGVVYYGRVFLDMHALSISKFAAN